MTSYVARADMAIACDTESHFYVFIMFVFWFICQTHVFMFVF